MSVHATTLYVIASHTVSSSNVLNSSALGTSHSTFPHGTSVNVESVVEVHVSVSTVIGKVHVRMMEEEMPSVVNGVDGEEPATSVPSKGTQEIVGCIEEIPLPVVEEMAEIRQTIIQVSSSHVFCSSHAEQIVEIYLIGVFILLVVQIQLVGHLVRQVQCFLTSGFVIHCVFTQDTAANHR